MKLILNTKKLLELLNNYNLIFEDKYFEYLPDNIKNDNYSIYLISNEIANKAEINIGTHGYVRLGKNTIIVYLIFNK